MSIVTQNNVLVNGKSFAGGTVFFPIDDDSAYASYTLPSMGCGVTYETGARVPWARFCPSIQLPKECRDDFARWAFGQDDERFMDLKLDPKDGELTYRTNIPSRKLPDIEKVLLEGLAFLEQQVYPEVIKLVGKKLVK